MSKRKQRNEIVDAIVLALVIEAGVAVLNAALVLGVRWLLTPGKDE